MAKIYLISPPNFALDCFSKKLHQALSTGLIPMFQLRIKNYSNTEIIKYIIKIKEICNIYKVKLIINDFYELALDLNCDGVHVGADDKKIIEIRKIAKNDFIIGSSCYDSKELAMQAYKDGANYISFGAFYESSTKKSRGKADAEILIWAKNVFKIPIVAIGGINIQNCMNLVGNKADFLAVISYVWEHPNGIEYAIKSMHDNISNF